MIDGLTKEIRREYLKLEKNKNRKVCVATRLYKIENEINNSQQKIAKLENDRDFLQLVDLYDSYKEFDFPHSISNIVINRTLYVGGHLFDCPHIDKITFGQLLELWRTSWQYKGNPIIYSWNRCSPYIYYWDLKLHKRKKAQIVMPLDVKKYTIKNRIADGNIGNIIRYITGNIKYVNI